MSQSEKVRARLQLLDERLARLRAEKDRLVARASRTERKRDTRRKIVIGGTVLAAMEHEGVPPLRTRAELVRWLDAQLSAAARPRGVRSDAAQVGLTSVRAIGRAADAAARSRCPPPVAGTTRPCRRRPVLNRPQAHFGVSSKRLRVRLWPA